MCLSFWVSALRILSADPLFLSCALCTVASLASALLPPALPTSGNNASEAPLGFLMGLSFLSRVVAGAERNVESREEQGHHVHQHRCVGPTNQPNPSLLQPNPMRYVTARACSLACSLRCALRCTGSTVGSVGCVSAVCASSSSRWAVRSCTAVLLLRRQCTSR